MRCSVGLLVAGCAIACAVTAQDYPNRAIRVLVPYAPGGTDHQMRVLAPTFSKLLGQPIVVENREGGGATIGAIAVKTAVPDGYTLLYTGSGALTVAPHMRKGVPYTHEDFTPIGNVTGTSFILTARPDLPYKTVGELIAYARANPGKVNYGSAGIGTTTHTTAAALDSAAKAPMTHVPFQGIGPAVRGLLGGQVDIAIGLGSAIMPQVNAGKLLGLASTGTQRTEFLPNAPTLREAGFDVVEVTKFGLFGPRGMPDAVVQRLVSVLAEAVKAPEFIDLARKTFNSVLYLPPAELRAVVDSESRYFRKLVADLKLAE